jgi:hypothetical protein
VTGQLVHGPARTVRVTKRAGRWGYWENGTRTELDVLTYREAVAAAQAEVTENPVSDATPAWNAEAYKAGFRNGFEAGKLAALRESVQPEETLAALRALAPPRRRQPTSASRRCHTCGHVDTTHNELGYCQARGKAGTDGCHCGDWIPPCLYVECDAIGRHRIDNARGIDWYCDAHIDGARLGA